MVIEGGQHHILQAEDIAFFELYGFCSFSPRNKFNVPSIVCEMLLFDLLSGYVPTEIEFPILVTFAFRLINMIFSVSFLRIWEMLKVWSVILSCDAAVETLVSLSSSSSRELELPNAFFTLNDSRSYVTSVSKLENRSVLKQMALIVDDGSLSHRFKENIEPFLIGLSGLLLRTAHVSFFAHR